MPSPSLVEIKYMFVDVYFFLGFYHMRRSAIVDRIDIDCIATISQDR